MPEDYVLPVDVKPRILFAGAEENLNDLLTMLKVEGYEVTSVTDEESLWPLLDDDGSELLVVDASLSDEVLRRLQEEKLEKGLPVILLIDGEARVVDHLVGKRVPDHFVIVPSREYKILSEVLKQVMERLWQRNENEKRDEEIEKLRQMNRKLRRLHSRMQMQLEAQKQYHATLAHELGTPVTLIHTYLQLVQDGTIDPIDHQYSDLALEKVVVLSRLVNDLQALSMIEKNEMGIRLEEVNVSDWLKRIRFSSEFMVRQAGIQFSWEVLENDEQSRLLIDFSRMDQVFQNLLANAMKHTSVEDGHITVRVQFDTSFQQLSIVVQDNGSGIAEADLPYIFKRYFKGTNQSESQGAGLGLAIVKEIVEGHHGRIHAHSKVGEGTSMVIDLPLLEE